MAKTRQMGFRNLAVLLIGAIAAAGQALASPCPGDCNHDGTVGVNEAIGAVQILLDRRALETCSSVDVNANGQVAVAEVMQVVRALLDGCPSMCGNGVVDPGEACDVGDPDVGCYEGCERICCTGTLDCLESKCCSDRDEGTRLVPFDPECRNCGELGESCGSSNFLEFSCCDELQCGETYIIGGRALSGRCCRPTGSVCDTNQDCCGPSEFPFSRGDTCVDGFCRRR